MTWPHLHRCKCHHSPPWAAQRLTPAVINSTTCDGTTTISPWSARFGTWRMKRTLSMSPSRATPSSSPRTKLCCRRAARTSEDYSRWGKQAQSCAANVITSDQPDKKHFYGHLQLLITLTSLKFFSGNHRNRQISSWNVRHLIFVTKIRNTFTARCTVG